MKDVTAKFSISRLMTNLFSEKVCGLFMELKTIALLNNSSIFPVENIHSLE